ncbi:MAG: hypothetical protein HY808_09540 [Nitrospirae bacterium]|nr:hypothetical protein [Nitrospirota bacterium]
MKKNQGLGKVGWKLQLVVLVVGVILGLGGDWAGATETITTENLLKNPGAEEYDYGTYTPAGTTTVYGEYIPKYWTDKNKNHEFRSRTELNYDGRKLIPNNGTYFFGMNGDNINNYAYQYVDVSTYATDIDEGNGTATFSGWLAEIINDKVKLIMAFCRQDKTEIERHNTGFQDHDDWKQYTIIKQIPKDTRFIYIEMLGERNEGQNCYAGEFDDLNLTLTYPKPPASKLEVIEPADKNLNFGDMYLAGNGSTKEYNKARKKTLKFKNAGDAGTTLNWKITTSSNEIKFSTEDLSGDLSAGQGKGIDVWVENLGSGNFTGWIKINDVTINVSAPVYDPAELSLPSWQLGTNDKVNVGKNQSISLYVSVSKGISYPGAKAAGYGWKKAASLTPDEITVNNFDSTTGWVKQYTFSESGNHTVYAASFETANDKKIVGKLLEIPIRAWNLPEVSNTPTGTTSWKNDKYVGVKGSSVTLQSTGVTKNNDSSESIAKFIWDLNNDWSNTELTQTAGQSASKS